MKKVKVKFLLLTLVSIILMTFAAGCSTTTGNQGGNKNKQAQGTEENKDKSLVIYTNSGSDGRAEWLTQKAAEKGFKLNVVTLGAGDLTNRLVAEKNNQIADVVIGLNAVEYEKLKKQDMLMKFKPSWAKDVDMTLGDKEGYYYPTVTQPLILAYNKKYYNDQTVPTDWTDLIKSEYKNKYTILDLGGGTSKTILASILVRYKDPNGQYGISQEGWDVAKKYLQNGHIEKTGEDSYAAVMNGQRPLIMAFGSGLLQHEKQLGTNLGIMAPKIGVPFVVEQVAIFNKSKKTDVAKEFVDWFGSAEVQAEWSQKFGTVPVQPDALAKAAPEVKELMANVKPQQIDWKFVADNMDKWMEKVQLEFLK